jgi:glycosyltransferase involved in cell wall biosynthesis
MTKHRRQVYLPANAKGGLVYTSLHAALARVGNYKIFIHHHNFYYIDHPSWLMRAMVRLAGSSAVHLFLCDVMRDGFERRYGAIRNSNVVSNAVFIRENLELERTTPPDRLIRLGHMSNLSHEKGLFDFLDLLRALRRTGVRFQGVLAGPADSPSVSAAIRDAQHELGAALDYRDAVYGDAKRAFFQDIDVFVFASRSEAQPNVVFEALSLGVPVIAYGRGCIGSDLSPTCGMVIPVDSDFVAAAHARIVSWVNDPSSLRACSVEARKTARRACEVSARAFEQMLDAIAGI